MEKFPEAVKKDYTIKKEEKERLYNENKDAFDEKVSIDTKILETNIEAADFLEIKETPYLQIRKVNDENF